MKMGSVEYLLNGAPKCRKNPYSIGRFELAPAGFELSASGPGRSLAVLKRLIAYGFRRIAVPTAPDRFRTVSTAP